MAEKWYYQSFGEEFGPVEFDTLEQLVRSGQVAPEDLVRTTSESWRPAGSIARFSAEPIEATAADFEHLFEVTNEAATPRGADDLLESLEIVDEPQSKPPAGRRLPQETWACRILGQELGPFSFAQLAQLAGAGELCPTDPVRNGIQDWRPAEEIVGLFEKRRDDDVAAGPTHVLAPQRTTGAGGPPAPPASDKSSAGSVKASPALPLPALPSPAASTAAPASSNKSHSRKPAASSAAPGAAQSRPSASASIPAPPVSPTTGSSSASPPPPRIVAPPPQRAFTPPPKSSRRSGGSALSGLKFNLPINWTYVGGAAAALAVLVGLYFVMPLGDRGEGIYEETLQIWTEVQRLKESKAGEAEWQAASQKWMPRVDELTADLSERASAKQRLLQLMLYCHRDCLKEILGKGTAAPPAKFKEMETYMNEAKNLVARS